MSNINMDLFKGMTVAQITEILENAKKDEKNKQFSSVFSEIEEKITGDLFMNTWLKENAIKTLKSQYQLYNDTDRAGAAVDFAKNLTKAFPELAVTTEFYHGSQKYTFELRPIKDVTRKTKEERIADLKAKIAEIENKNK